MRVLLTIPSFAYIYGSYQKLYEQGFLNPPLSLCYIAAAVEKAGHTAKIIDAEAHRLTIDQILQQAKDFNTELFAVTATSVDFNGAEELIKRFKQAFPEVPVIIGGAHVNIFEKEVLDGTPEIDYGCIGDGEDLMPELLEVLSSGDKSGLEKIPGLIYRENGETIQNEYRPVEKNLDRYPFPARHLLDNDLYVRGVPFAGTQTTAAFMSSRGCPFKCVYCAVDKISGGTAVRLRSPENVLDELELIVNKMGIKHIYFNDDCLTSRKSRIHAICEGIHKRNLKFTWEGISRADCVDKELLTAMKKAGFVRISYGIESGNENILKVINKGETLDKIENAYRITREVGLVARGSIIIGSPYETKETVKDTFRFIRRLKGLDQVLINILQPYPGTKVREMILQGEGGSKFLRNTDNTGKLQRFGSASISVNDLSPEDLVFLQKWGFFLFYVRPRILLRNLRISGANLFFREGIGFLRSLLTR